MEILDRVNLGKIQLEEPLHDAMSQNFQTGIPLKVRNFQVENLPPCDNCLALCNSKGSTVSLNKLNLFIAI
jgi:hypothetical protein